MRDAEGVPRVPMRAGVVTNPPKPLPLRVGPRAGPLGRERRRQAKQSGAGRKQGGVQKVTACNGGIETEISLLAGEPGRTSHRAIRGWGSDVRANKNP
jgi:hypothetical protein